jgi:hypothetical protein
VAYGLNQTFADVGSIIELTVVPWGNAAVGADGVWQCQHGPLECVGNTIESCVLHYHTEQEVWFPFVLAFEAAQPTCGRGNQTATNNPVACAERIAKELSLPWAPIASCFEKFDAKTGAENSSFCAVLILKTIVLPRQARDNHRENSKQRRVFSLGMPPKDSLGFKLQMEAKAATDALVPAHSGVPTVTYGVRGPYIDTPSQNYLKCFVCAAYTGDSPAACKDCDAALPSPSPPGPAVDPADAQAISLTGELLAAPPLTPDGQLSCDLHLAAAQAEYDADVLPALCKAASASCKGYGANFTACMGDMCCSILPDPELPPPGYGAYLPSSVLTPALCSELGGQAGRPISCPAAGRHLQSVDDGSALRVCLLLHVGCAPQPKEVHDAAKYLLRGIYIRNG